MMSEGGGPMTPPMSPSEEGMGDSITIDSEPRFSGPTHPPIGMSSHRTMQRQSSWVEEGPVRSHTPPRPPLRLLEDEQEHVEQSGLLRLKDFEIKGTLGQFI